MRHFLFLLLTATAIAQDDARPPASASPFTLLDGDRVLLLGDALLERENTFGHLETRMHEQFPNVKFTVRNLSWSGETPRGWSRASFDGPDKGYARLKENIAAVKPTVAILGFGMAASLQEMTDRSGDILLNRDPARYGAEPMSAGRFKKELGELMDAIGKDTRFILLSPIRHEDLRATRPGLPDPAPHNALLEAYTAAIADIATERGARFVNLHAPAKFTGADLRGAITDNGIHLNDRGAQQVTRIIGFGLGWHTPGDERLRGALRPAVLRKNDLFFHQFRPANSTYLFGFRKHEQGKNAAEIPQFDPLIEAADAEIDRIKRGQADPPAGSGVSPAPPNVEKPPQQITPPRNERKPTLDEPGGTPAPAGGTPALPAPTFTLGDGLEMSLWADTKLVSKPVGMNWDAAGRLWVACSPVYPQIRPGGHPEDKVVVIEDTDHDGKADKSTTFASGLIIAAGVAPDFGASMDAMDKIDGKPAQKAHTAHPVRPNACYVGASTELLRLEDTDGDGKADVRRVVLSGFGTEDTHHTIHTLKWGPDGRLYFNQSIYIHSHVETPWGMVRLNSAGICAYDPRTERVEVHAKGWCNPWGHVWDEWGQEFVTDGAGYQGISWLVPGAMYFTYENARRIMPSISPGTYPKYCGLELVRSPLFPADWQGNAITCDFRAHRIVRFQINDLSPAKSGYLTKELAPLVVTTDASFRPIDVNHGPDGALYFADWTNPIINHGEVDFRDPRRDHVNGRIWRLAPKGKALAWGSHSTAVKALAPEGRDPKTAAAKIKSEKPRVRVEAMRALARIPTIESAALVLEAAVNAPGGKDAAAALPGAPKAQFDNATASETGDTHYAYAAWLSVTDLAPQVAEWVEKNSGTAQAAPASRDAMLTFALQTLPAGQSGPLLSKIIAKNGVPRDGSGPWIELIGQSGGPDECRVLLDALLAATTPDSDQPRPLADAALKFTTPAAVQRAAAALVAAARRGVKPPNAGAGWQFFHYAPAAPDVVRLAGLWKEKGVADAIAARMDADASPALRDAIFESLRALASDEAARTLAAFLDPQRDAPNHSAFLKIALRKNDADLRRRALAALAAFRPDAAHAALKGVLSEADEPALLPLWRELFASEAYAKKFASDIPKDLPKPAIAAALRAARELGRKGEKLAAALTPLTGEAPAPAVTQDYAALVELTKKNGNPVEGEALYRRAALTCTVCHAIGGAGGKVGPDLTTIGASAPLDYIIESMMAPAAKVKEGYHAVALTLKGGRSATGVVARESDKEIVLRDATGAESTVAKGDITARENIGSLMPAGLLATLSQREQTHVFAFLAALGKPGPFDATKANVARTWELFPGKDVEAVVAGKSAAPGAKVLTMVDGRLLKTQLTEALQMIPGTGDTVIAVTRFTGSGKTRLHLTGITKAWLDGAPLAIASETKPEVELRGGTHTLAVKLDTASLPEVVRAGCDDARFLGE